MRLVLLEALLDGEPVAVRSKSKAPVVIREAAEGGGRFRFAVGLGADDLPSLNSTRPRAPRAFYHEGAGQSRVLDDLHEVEDADGREVRRAWRARGLRRSGIGRRRGRRLEVGAARAAELRGRGDGDARVDLLRLEQAVVRPTRSLRARCRGMASASLARRLVRLPAGERHLAQLLAQLYRARVAPDRLLQTLDGLLRRLVLDEQLGVENRRLHVLVEVLL